MAPAKRPLPIDIDFSIRFGVVAFRNLIVSLIIHLSKLSLPVRSEIGSVFIDLVLYGLFAKVPVMLLRHNPFVLQDLFDL